MLKNQAPNDFGVSRLSKSGQVHVPKDLRERMQLKNGQKFMVYEQDGDIILAPMGALKDFGDREIKLERE